MKQMTFSQGDVERTIAELTQKSDEFKVKLKDLLTAQGELSSQWSGDASEAFKTAFLADKAQWDKFAGTLDNYIQTLQSISNAYGDAERRNVEIATTRKYR